MVKKITRYLICTISSISVTLLVEEALSELIVLWYMRANQIIYRSDLSEDYGLGMLGFFSSIVAFVICFPVSFFIIWKLLKKYFA